MSVPVVITPHSSMRKSMIRNHGLRLTVVMSALAAVSMSAQTPTTAAASIGTTTHRAIGAEHGRACWPERAQHAFR